MNSALIGQNAIIISALESWNVRTHSALDGWNVHVISGCWEKILILSCMVGQTLPYIHMVGM